jgi:hypothetical protein
MLIRKWQAGQIVKIQTGQNKMSFLLNFFTICVGEKLMKIFKYYRKHEA